MTKGRMQLYGLSQSSLRLVGQYVMMTISIIGTSLVVVSRAGLSLLELCLFWTGALGGLALIILLVMVYTYVSHHWRA